MVGKPPAPSSPRTWDPAGADWAPAGPGQKQRLSAGAAPGRGACARGRPWGTRRCPGGPRLHVYVGRADAGSCGKWTQGDGPPRCCRGTPSSDLPPRLLGRGPWEPRGAWPRRGSPPCSAGAGRSVTRDAGLLGRRSPGACGHSSRVGGTSRPPAPWGPLLGRPPCRDRRGPAGCPRSEWPRRRPLAKPRSPGRPRGWAWASARSADGPPSRCPGPSAGAQARGLCPGSARRWPRREPEEPATGRRGLRSGRRCHPFRYPGPAPPLLPSQ